VLHLNKLMKKIMQKVSGISSRTFLYLFAVSALVCIFALRHNNEHMIKLRNAVYAADQANGDVNQALNSLRQYVYAHMNTDLSSGHNGIKPPIQLKYTYQRLYDAQLSQVQTANQAVYSAAQQYCHGAANQNSQAAQNTCIQNYAAGHGVKGTDINIPKGLYEFDFISPAWSPDLAGWTLVLSLTFFIGFAVKFAVTKSRK
jgi:hypothetical protein